jgi:hypothetical protein
MVMMPRRAVLSLMAAAALASLTACSGMNTLSADAQSFGSWPAGRVPGSFAFERLPSQQSSKQQDELERVAQAALEKVGFKRAADAKSADVLVSLGVRISRQDRAPWDDPLWWRWNGSYFHWRYGPWRPYFGRLGHPYPVDPMMERRYDREVAMLLRDRKSGEPLYEARASDDSFSIGDIELIGSLFQASLADFPQTRPEPHRVVVQLSPAGATK